jgi:L-gulonolactone oxidase
MSSRNNIKRNRVENWSQTFSSRPRVVRRVHTVAEVAAGLEEARREGAPVRLLGAAQSPNDIAMSEEHLLIIRGLKKIREIDRERREVVAEAGITLGELAVAIAREGLALPNLASITRQTLGGAAATGTHGTGVAWGSLPTWIEEFEMVSVDGAVLDTKGDSELLRVGRLSLGSLGVQTAFRLRVVPEFDLRVEEGPVDLKTAMQPEWYGEADHARVWYLPHVDHAWGWRAWRITHEHRRDTARESGLRRWWRDRVLGYQGFQAGLWLAASVPALLPAVNRAYSGEFLSRPKTSAGGSVEQFTFDCLFHQRVTEWAVPIDKAEEAVLSVRKLAEQGGFQAHLPIEIRFTAGDDIPLSPTFGGDRCWIGIVSYIPWGREIEWRPWFEAFEQQMLAFDGRPHWAKQFSARPGRLRELYPEWDSFQALRRRLDPEQTLRNSYTERVLSESHCAPIAREIWSDQSVRNE